MQFLNLIIEKSKIAALLAVSFKKIKIIVFVLTWVLRKFLKLFNDSLLNQMNTINISHSEHFQEFTNARFTSYSEAVQSLRDKGTELGFAFKVLYQNPALNIGMVFGIFLCEKGRKAPDYTVRTNL